MDIFQEAIGEDSDSVGGKRRKGDLDNPDKGEEDEILDDEEDADKVRTVEIRMPGARPDRDDDYFCTGFDIRNLTGPDTVYIQGEIGFTFIFTCGEADRS